MARISTADMSRDRHVQTPQVPLKYQFPGFNEENGGYDDPR